MINEDGEIAVSDEHFGNKVDRKVKLSQDLSLWQGKKVHLEFFLKDAHIYLILCKFYFLKSFSLREII